MSRPEQRIRVDRSKPLAAQPEVGHNRWHPDIPPITRVAPEQRIVLETRDAVDGQVRPGMPAADLLAMDLDLAHPLTGPVWVEGAEPGDLLEVRVLDVEPDSFGFTSHLPGFGFLRDDFPEPWVFDWRIGDGLAESPGIPGVRIGDASFAGTIGVAPSRRQLEEAREREQRLLERGGAVFPPQAKGAVPTDVRIATGGLRTIPPREFAGNLDVRQLTRGARLYLPVNVPGALFSIGDGHFAQGDGEVCGAAIEMRAAFHLEFALGKGEATRRRITGPVYARSDASPAEARAARGTYATVGIPVDRDGENESEDATLAARRALDAMLEHLVGDLGYDRAQAYAIMSVAVDLRLSSVVNVPNIVVSAVLPLDIFT